MSVQVVSPDRPKRLYPLRYHARQDALRTDPQRFKVVPAGRRSGKTELAKRKVVVSAIGANETLWDDPRFFAAAPTRDQARAIYWADIKAMFPPVFIRNISESHLTVYLENGSEASVVGMDKPQRIEGVPWDGGVLDEFANMKKQAWGENVRPALSDRKGWCWLIGVPEGRNHYYDLNRYALSGVDPDWASYSWPSADILDPAEVAAAKRQLDELVFQQEYEASFVNFEGRAYYPFTEATHCAPLVYDPDAPLILCFDFNIAPGVCAIAQEQLLPKQYERSIGGAVLLDRPISGTGWIGEVYIPQNSNTPAVCRKIIADWGDHRGEVHLYGDATGGAGGTAKVDGSDWDLISYHLDKHFGSERVFSFVPPGNPEERIRVNSVNTRFRNGAGEIRMMVDAAKCPHLVTDFEGVRTLEGGSGEIDKKTDKRLTHISDGAGYYIVAEFPIYQNTPQVTSLYGSASNRYQPRRTRS